MKKVMGENKINVEGENRMTTNGESGEKIGEKSGM